MLLPKISSTSPADLVAPVSTTLNIFPNISLTNVVSQSHIIGDAGDLTLVNSDISITGSFNSCIGDVNSSVKKDTIAGSASFNNVDNVDVVLDCPLPNVNYVVFVQNISSGEHPVVTQKTAVAFNISVAQNINEVVYYTILQ